MTAETIRETSLPKRLLAAFLALTAAVALSIAVVPAAWADGELDVLVSASPNPAHPGDTVTVSVKVTNANDDVVQGIVGSVEKDLVQLNLPYCLEPGQSATASSNYVVTPSDLEAGAVEFKAGCTGHDGGGQFFSGYNKCTVTVKQAKKPLTDAMCSLSRGDTTYDGSAQVPEVIVKDGDVVLEEGVDYSVWVDAEGSGMPIDASQLVNVGCYYFHVDGMGGYEGSRILLYWINARPVSISVPDRTVGYSGGVQYGEAAVTVEGLVEGHTAAVAYTPAEGTEPGTYDNGSFGGDCTILDGQGEDVTGNYCYTEVKWMTPGKLTILAAKATLTFDLGGGALDGKTGTITIVANKGETINLPGAPTKEGYTFKCWKGSEYAAGAEYTVEGDHAFTAEWEKDSGEGIPATGDSAGTTAVALSMLALLSCVALAACTAQRRIA